MKKIVPFLIFISQIIYAQIPNILISNQFEPEEVCIAINPKNTKQIIAGSNLNSAYYSFDEGFTWERTQVKCSPYGVYGDPVVFWDTTQAAYFMNLSMPNKKNIIDGSWIDRIVINKSKNFGKTYDTCYAFGKNGSKVQDKHWVAVDPKTNFIHVSWTQFDKYESKLNTDSTIIRYSNSKDGGISWSEPIRLSKFGGDCLDGDSTVEGAVPCIGPKGQVYIAWAGPKGLCFTKSTDGGNTFLKQEKIINPIKNGWDQKVDGLFRANGLPFTACDNSNGPNKGRIYICWSDEKNGIKNKDVFLTFSDDEGENWCEPILVTYHPNHKEQFMPFLTIDQTTGYVYILYYSRQNYVSGDLTDVYMAISKNGGLKFEYYKINEESFHPNKLIFFGDYIGLSAVNSVVRPIWMQLHNLKLSIHTAIFNDSIAAIYNSNQLKKNIEIINSNLKFQNKITLKINSKIKTKIDVAIYDALKPESELIVYKNKKIKIGNTNLLIDTDKLQLKKGTYVVFLYYNNTQNYYWITEE
ncbi:MAG: sialidase family protein [Bacteroidia bacterium]